MTAREMTPAEHAATADAVAFWRQFEVTWDPQEQGDAVIGTVTAYKDVKLGGRLYPEVSIRSDVGNPVVVLATQKRLVGLLVKRRPRVGDRILIEYQGEDDTAARGFSPTQRFRVLVRGEVPAAGEGK